MTSIGNDIVSLNSINIARSKQPAFYSKILSDTEKDIYYKEDFVSIPFEIFVWLLWSIKESAYKYMQRLEPGLIFSPIKFIVKLLQVPLGYTVTRFEATETEGVGFHDNSVFKGVITYGTVTLYSRSLIYNELIISVVNDSQIFENICWGIKLIGKPDPGSQSIEVRRCLINRLQSLFPLNECTTGKSLHGFPVILNNKNEEANIPVSLSHHGQLVAYAFKLGDISK
jgi:phosphopantetheinyl transferase (holo-ACP synthase)